MFPHRVGIGAQLDEQGDGRGLERLAGAEEGRLETFAQRGTLRQQVAGDGELALEASAAESVFDIRWIAVQQRCDDVELAEIGRVRKRRSPVAAADGRRDQVGVLI